MINNLNSIHLEVAILIKEVATPYIVGGAVRDFMLGKEPHDIDWASEASIESLIPIFQEADWDIKETGTAFKILFISKLGYQFEVAQFRKDVACDGRHAIVEAGSIMDDAQRRDFTCNSLYYDVFNDMIVDPTNMGVRDMNSKVLRFVGKPQERIREDYLRIFRYYRFLQKTGFSADPKSLRACRELFGEAYSKLTPERVRMEMEKLVGLV